MEDLLCSLYKKLYSTGMDAMDVIVDTINAMRALGEVRNCLLHLISEDCDLELPMNIKVPIKTILEHEIILSGIFRLVEQNQELRNCLI